MHKRKGLCLLGNPDVLVASGSRLITSFPVHPVSAASPSHSLADAGSGTHIDANGGWKGDARRLRECPRTFWILEEHSDTGWRTFVHKSRNHGETDDSVSTLHRLVIRVPISSPPLILPLGGIPFGPRVSCAVVLISADTTAVLRLWLPPSSPGGATSSHPPSTWDGPNLASVQSPSAFWCIALVQHVSDLSIPPHSESTKTRTGEGNSPSPSSPLAHEFLVLRS
ncbi:hypothetical protein B0H13DRAFT_2378191 [Mycena leptocephala]|nr:hypothetical protein B0H13DRAFT_2378191 [Mycena leptocephala]